MATQWRPGRVLPSSAFFRGMAGRIQKCSVMIWAHRLYTEYSPILSSFCNARLILSAHMLFRAAQQTNLPSPLTDILSSTSSGMRNITSNPQHHHSGGGSSSRWVDNSGQSVSHCRTVLRTYVYFNSRHRLCRSEKDSISLNILLLTSHGSVDESWMGAPFDLAGVDERAPISKILPHDMWQE